ncbi:hypothetical protein L3X38_019092 [Prunus dulcis]|uniref:Uncharacterized protein n=1 Tax=Prunus dulcis TaxID=3755 RepID=A0AAD4ZBC7_PRUDU|nr:hypothetical protein L3X38_019092 [Prunus dulcis]
MEENRLFDILDAQVMKDGGKDEIVAVANLAKRCLNLKGKKRPTMKQVAVELEGIQQPVKASDMQQTFANVEYVRCEITEHGDIVSASKGSSCINDGVGKLVAEN